MSRCFPYPPPGYEKSPALIKSMKLQKEKEKAKKERKKEKKKEKKEKPRGDNGKREEKWHNHKKRRHEKVSQPNPKAGDCIKTREDEGAQLERSSLTEEQGPPSVLNLCDSPESTQHSNKRQRHEPAEVSHKPPGSGLRIRLPLLRREDSERTSSTAQPCFSGRIETVSDQAETRVAGQKESVSSVEQPCFSGRTDAAPSQELVKKIPDGKVAPVESGRVHRSRCCCDSDVRRQYKNLIVNWNPPPLQVENPESDDEDWLFGKTARRPRHEEVGETSGQVASEDSDIGNAPCSWPPRACYMPEVGMYALPYVVPF